MEHEDASRVYRGNIDKLVHKIMDERGLDLSQYRPRYVERRVAIRLHRLDLHTYRQYAAYLDKHPEEYPLLFDALTVNVTNFFRDPTVFESFRKNVIPEIVSVKERRHQRIIRVWSAGCSTGQEAYSIMMAFLTELGAKADRFMLSVLATDVDEEALATARKGVYEAQELAHIPRAEQLRFVDVDGPTFSIRPEAASRVRFQHLNLFADRPIQVVDVIFCRNVFIYFNKEQQQRVLELFWQSLARGGFLVLGRSERVVPSIARRFELVDGKERIYRKPLAM